MISIVVADGRREYELLDRLAARSGEADRKITDAVTEIIRAVREEGDAAVDRYTRRFDGVPAGLTPLTPEELRGMARQCDPAVYAALERAAANIRDFHERQIKQSWLTTRPDGTITGQRIRGLDRVGVYVPGGTAAYPSSVLMNVIPARIAGVREIIMVTPPARDLSRADGLSDEEKGVNLAAGINYAVIAAAVIAGVDKLYFCGGAQAVAALACGTESIPRVDKIVGPGNAYVAAAKKLLFGQVDIDMIAGPSEILVLADGDADPAFIAADLLSQAEHDALASSILLTTSEDVARRAVAELEVQASSLPRIDIVRRSLENYGAAIVCRDMDEAVALANRLAPEHLEVLCASPMDYLGRLDNAGSVFLGAYSPESLGDYAAGPNHVLPTGGTARFFSPLSVDSFVKKSSFIYYTRDALGALRDTITTIAQAEGLTAHARAADIRFREEA